MAMEQHGQDLKSQGIAMKRSEKEQHGLVLKRQGREAISNDNHS